MQASEFSPTYRSYELNLEKYHGKDIVHKGWNLILNSKVAWEKIGSKTRNMIRKAQKTKNLTIKRVQGTTKDLLSLQKIWFDSSGDTLPSKLKPEEIMYLAYLNKEVIGGMILTPSGNNLYLHYLASSQEGRTCNIATLLIWNAVKELENLDYKFIDVGVSFRSHLYTFFKNLGTHSYPIIFEAPTIKPTIRLTPFDNSSLNISFENLTKNDLNQTQHIIQKEFTYFPRAVYAIIALLRHLKLKRNEEVAILKTFDNDYIARCVTEPIETVCRWSREINSKTKAIFIIHEFGYPYKHSAEIKKWAHSKGIPLIEDCAWTMGTKIGKETVGDFGNFCIYSLPKIFPMQHGAIVTGVHFDDKTIWNEFYCLDTFKQKIVEKELAYHLPKLKHYNAKRRKNWLYLNAYFKNEGFDSFTELKKGVYPACLLIKTPHYQEWHDRLEKFGIESGCYYHEESIFLPIHQNLGPSHLDYIYAAIRGDFNLCNSYRGTK